MTDLRGSLYNVLTEFDVTKLLTRAIKIRLNETCGIAWIGRHMYDTFPVKKGLEQGDASSPLLSSLV